MKGLETLHGGEEVTQKAHINAIAIVFIRNIEEIQQCTAMKGVD